MAIPKIDKQDIIEALKSIDPEKILFRYKSVKYFLVTEDGKKYPPKYVIVEAVKMANGVNLSFDDFNSIDANKFLTKLGFTIETKPGKNKTGNQQGNVQQSDLEQFASMLAESKNLIFHGAPGTGKSHLAIEIAAYIISHGHCIKYEDLSDEQKQQMEFVQFHPSYDYTDFVEGLRPVNKNGAMVFELQDGIFKKFVARVRKNYEDSNKSVAELKKEDVVQKSMKEFFLSIEPSEDVFTLKHGNTFMINSVTDKEINIVAPKNNPRNREITLKIDELRSMLESSEDITEVQYVAKHFDKPIIMEHSYYYVIYRKIKEIMKKNETSSTTTEKPAEKEFIFIIDEINRGEISKIFGELFFAIDPGYRGKKGEVSTQYANMHPNPNEKFYIPENVYIIGTMNDIDRSVDSFDFAMRRRFRFVELKANDRLEMLDSLGEKKEEAKNRMDALNKKISEHLNDNYHIGPAYFRKLKDLEFDFDQLWTDYLQPLLHDYIQGMPDEKDIMDQFAEAYGNKKPTEDSANGAPKD